MNKRTKTKRTTVREAEAAERNTEAAMAEPERQEEEAKKKRS